jgi:Heparinase II/III-like protein/Heparinase II/III N-terminus
VTAATALRLTAGRVERRDVYCVIEHERRDSAVAEAVLAGRFENFGQTLTLGLEPDWSSASLPADEEWRIAWSKFYDGLDLAHAFGATGDRRFLRCWERLVASWIGSVPADADSSDVAARRVQNWLYTWQRFAASPTFPGLSPGLDRELARSIAEQTAFIRANLTPARNHRTFELYTLFLVPLALPATDPGGDRLTDAIRSLHENLLTDVLPDGVHCECSTHYHLLALRSFLGARENARRFGLRFPDGFDRHLGRACTFALHCHRPDGEIPALSDSDTGSYLELIALAADLLGRADLRYVATAGAHGRPPRRRYAGFPAGGYFFQRSGWGTDGTPFAGERFLVFDCGPIGAGGHGHYDLLSIEAAAGGRPLLVDPGRFTYAETGSPNWRRWFKGTAAHNTVCVDGLDQTPYRRRKPKGPVAEGRFRRRLTAPGLDVLHGEAASPCYDAVHARRVVFVGDEYWLVEDRLRAAEPHHYDLRFHLAPDAWDATRISHDGRAGVVRAPGLALVLPGPVVPVLEQGWFAPEYGRRLPAPVVSVAVEDATNARFLTLVAPLDGAEPAPDVRVRATEEAAVVEVEGQGWRDVVTWTSSQAAWWRSSDAGEPLSFRLCGAGEDWLAWDRDRSFRRGSETP